MIGHVRGRATAHHPGARGARRLASALLVVLVLVGAGPAAAVAVPAAGGARSDGRPRAAIAIAPDGNAYDVNERGVVVGYRYGDQGQAAFRWRDGELVDLGSGIAYAVNDAGVVVGTAGGQAVRWLPDGTVEQLAPGSLYSEATDIDSRGTIVGSIGLPGGSNRAFVLPPGASEVEILPVPAGHEDDSASAAAINERGTIVGALQVTSGDVSSLALVWQGRSHRVSALPGTGDSAYVGDVNNQGVIVGATLVGGPEGSHFRALRWTDPARPPEEIGALGTDSIARGINERGLVVGVQYRTGVAFQWDPHSGRTTLLPGLGDGYSDAWAVSDRAVAVGNSAVTVAGASTATVFGRP